MTSSESSLHALHEYRGPHNIVDQPSYLSPMVEPPKKQRGAAGISMTTTTATATATVETTDHHVAENPFISSLLLYDDLSSIKSSSRGEVLVVRDGAGSTVSSSPSRVLDLRERLAHPMSISANPFSSKSSRRRRTSSPTQHQQPDSTDSTCSSIVEDEDVKSSRRPKRGGGVQQDSPQRMSGGGAATTIPVMSAQVTKSSRRVIENPEQGALSGGATTPPVSSSVNKSSSSWLFEDPEDPFASYYSRLDHARVVKKTPMKTTDHHTPMKKKKKKKGHHSRRSKSSSSHNNKAPAIDDQNKAAAASQKYKYSVSIQYCDASGKIEDVPGVLAATQNGGQPPEVRGSSRTIQTGSSTKTSHHGASHEKGTPIDDPNDISMYFQTGEASVEKEEWKEDTSWMSGAASLTADPSRASTASSKERASTTKKEEVTSSDKASSNETTSSKEVSSSKEALRREKASSVQALTARTTTGHTKELPVLRRNSSRQRKKERMVRSYSSSGREKRQEATNQQRVIGSNRCNKRDSNDDDLFDDISKVLLSLGPDDAAAHAIVLHNLLPTCYRNPENSTAAMLTTIVDNIESLVLDHSCGAIDTSFVERGRSYTTAASISSSSSSCVSSMASSDAFTTSVSAASAVSQYDSVDDQSRDGEDVSRATSTNFADDKKESDTDDDTDIKVVDRTIPVQDGSKIKKKTTSQKHTSSADIMESPRGMGRQNVSEDIIVSDIKDTDFIAQASGNKSIMGGPRDTIQDEFKNVKQKRTKVNNNRKERINDSPRARRQHRTKKIAEIINRQNNVVDDHPPASQKATKRNVGEDSLMFCGIADDILHDVFKKRAALRLATASPPPPLLNVQNTPEIVQQTSASKVVVTGRDMNAEDVAATTESHWMHEQSHDIKWPKKLSFMLQKLRCPATGALPSSLLCQRDEDYEYREPHSRAEV
jgi:hypothetical protein